LASLAYVRHDLVVPFFEEAIEPLIDDLPEDFPDVAHDYFEYVIRTYIGRRAGRSVARRRPMFKPELWSSFEDVIADLPTTNNALESFNARWNSSRLLSDNIWSVMTGFQREDALAYERYLNDIPSVANPKLSPLEGTTRKINHRDYCAKLKNVALKIDETPAIEYLSIVASLMKRISFE